MIVRHAHSTHNPVSTAPTILYATRAIRREARTGRAQGEEFAAGDALDMNLFLGSRQHAKRDHEDETSEHIEKRCRMEFGVCLIGAVPQRQEARLKDTTTLAFVVGIGCRPLRKRAVDWTGGIEYVIEFERLLGPWLQSMCSQY
jgi:hypothetical protein